MRELFFYHIPSKLFVLLIYIQTVSISACMHPKLLQVCPTLCSTVDHSLLGSSVHGILQARMEWVAVPSFRGSSRPRDQTHICHWQKSSLPLAPLGKCWFLYTDFISYYPTAFSHCLYGFSIGSMVNFSFIIISSAKGDSFTSFPNLGLISKWPNKRTPQQFWERSASVTSLSCRHTTEAYKLGGALCTSIALRNTLSENSSQW